MSNKQNNTYDETRFENWTDHNMNKLLEIYLDKYGTMANGRPVLDDDMCSIFETDEFCEIAAEEYRKLECSHK